MNKNRYGPYSLGIIVLLLSTTTPVFAEVTSLQTNSNSFYKGDKITFSGTVEEGSTGLITIVIRDFNDKFVMLSQAIINHDDTFEKTIQINDKFSEHGIYNATGFILNMTKGVTTEFGVSTNGSPVILGTLIESVEEPKPVVEESKPVVEEPKPVVEEQESTIASFVDTSKDPQYYIDRYYNEIAYKSWFDKNYPNLTIEEAVGYTNNVEEIKSTVQEIIDKEIIPEAQASSIVEPIKESNDNQEIAQIALAIAGLGILLGAVYGVKRQVDHNSRQISINRDTIRKKLINPIVGSNPKQILQTRLAKGEITLKQYEKLISKLD